eukprot:Ihof_evm2s206 gene=Ihof_evmTU2s206
MSRRNDVTRAETALKAKYKKLIKLKDLVKSQANNPKGDNKKRPAEADDDHLEAAKRLLEAERRKASQSKDPVAFLQKSNPIKRPRSQSTNQPPPNEPGFRPEAESEDRTPYQPQQPFVSAGWDGAGQPRRSSQTWQQ